MQRLSLICIQKALSKCLRYSGVRSDTAALRSARLITLERRKPLHNHRFNVQAFTMKQTHFT